MLARALHKRFENRSDILHASASSPVVDQRIEIRFRRYFKVNQISCVTSQRFQQLQLVAAVWDIAENASQIGKEHEITVSVYKGLDKFPCLR
jgi:hypothetical protein